MCKILLNIISHSVTESHKNIIFNPQNKGNKLIISHLTFNGIKTHFTALLITIMHPDVLKIGMVQKQAYFSLNVSVLLAIPATGVQMFLLLFEYP